DRWGERVIRFVDKPPRLSLLEYLYFAGDDRFGALGVSTSRDEYLPRRLGPLPTLAQADEIHELVRKIQANEPVPEALKRLISPPAATLNSPIRGRVKFPQLTSTGRRWFTRSERALQLERPPLSGANSCPRTSADASDASGGRAAA